MCTARCAGNACHSEARRCLSGEESLTEISRPLWRTRNGSGPVSLANGIPGSLTAAVVLRFACHSEARRSLLGEESLWKTACSRVLHTERAGGRRTHQQ